MTVAASSAALAPTAAADQDVDWDRVAACESGGNWSINTGTNFTGGLQFLDSTWRAYGGSTARAYQASRSEQIRVAERVRAGQGIGAWPVCGPRGLGGTTANPGTTGSSASSAAPRTGRGDAAPSVARSSVPAAPSRSAGSRTSTVTDEPTATTSRPRVHTTAPQSGPQHRRPTPHARGDGTVRVHVVHRGDTLSGIARTNHTTWPRVHAVNSVITDPDLIFPGQRVSLP